MILYTERHGIRAPKEKTYTINRDMYSLLFDCCQKYKKNLTHIFTLNCHHDFTDSDYIAFDEKGFTTRIKVKIPSLFRDEFDRICAPTYDFEYDQYALQDETPAYLEWVLWRAALAIDHMVNKPYEVRGFRLDSDFLPVSAAGGGKGDLYWEYEDFTILTEVTMSNSSRQEAMEGEPVRRHVSDAVLKYDKPVYRIFIALKIDTNTAETFRHGIQYAKGDVKQRLDIVPLTLAQFQRYFVAMFETKQAVPDRLRALILKCESNRDLVDAPMWKLYIDEMVREKADELRTFS